MAATDPEIFGNTLQKTHSWLTDVMRELGWEDRRKAYVAHCLTIPSAVN